MWLWHRKLTRENRGLSLLKPAQRNLSIQDLPINWRDHLAVVTRQRAKIRIQGVEKEDAFDALTAAHPRVPLDDAHKETIERLMGTGFSTIWVSDHHLLQTHTCALAKLGDPTFKTISEGTDPSIPNCFLFPLNNGAWRVYRFSPGVAEAETWMQDGQGWTTCYFNKKPDLEMACRAHSGLKDPDKGGFAFNRAEDAVGAAKVLGETIAFPLSLDRPAQLLTSKSGNLVVRVKSREEDPRELHGWIRKRGEWVRESSRVVVSPEREETDEHSRLRALETPQGERAGFLWLNDGGEWKPLPTGDALSVLRGTRMDKNQAEQTRGHAISNPWKLTVLPFQPLFPGGRQVNLYAPQFCVKPQEGPHPAWDKIFAHLGAGLTGAIQATENPWFRQNGVEDGAHYLLLWTACALREPFESLPYLAYVGPESVGKSTHPEAIAEYLLDGGVTSADKALTNSSGFNGELEGAVLCYVEETDVSARTARDRMKEWVTAPRLPIRRMRQDLYHVANTTHWIQCTNHVDYVPVFPGDSRITLCWVNHPAKKEKRAEFREALKEESPCFLHTLLNLPLPTPDERLRIPIVETEEKQEVAMSNEPVARFVQEACVLKTGARTAVDEMYNTYMRWCFDESIDPIGKIHFGRQLHEFSCGRIKPGKMLLSSPDGKAGGKRPNAYMNVELREVTA